MIFALIGNQNCGKTTLFNQMTGSNQHVGNFLLICCYTGKITNMLIRTCHKRFSFEGETRRDY